MKFSRAQVKAAVSGDRESGRALQVIVARCAGIGADKAGAGEHSDDVQQELWFFLMRNWTRLDDDYNIEPYLIETARKIAMGQRRRYGMYGTGDEPDQRTDEAPTLGGDEPTQDFEDATIEEADRGAALRYLAATIPSFSALVQKEAISMAKTAPTEQKARRKQNADAVALKKLREKSNLTQIDMALRLGLKLPTYQSYEYGRTKRIPSRVMQAARDAIANPKQSAVSKFDGRSMYAIATGWARRMGIDPKSPSKFAMAIGIDKATASRWLTRGNVIKLSQTDLLTYELRAQREEAYYQESLKRHKKARK